MSQFSARELQNHANLLLNVQPILQESHKMVNPAGAGPSQHFADPYISNITFPADVLYYANKNATPQAKSYKYTVTQDKEIWAQVKRDRHQ